MPRSASGISGGAADGKGISVSWTHLARNSGEESYLERFFPLGYLDMLGWSSPALCGPLVLVCPEATSFMASIWGTPITFWRNAILSLSCCVLSLVLLMPRLFACCNVCSVCSASCYVLSSALVACSLQRLPGLWFSLLRCMPRATSCFEVCDVAWGLPHERACELDLVMHVNASSWSGVERCWCVWVGSISPIPIGLFAGNMLALSASDTHEAFWDLRV
jgi:hypothetical protein